MDLAAGFEIAAALPPAPGQLATAFNKLGTAQAERAAVRIGLPATSYPKAIDETGWQAATRLTALTARGVDLLTLL